MLRIPFPMCFPQERPYLPLPVRESGGRLSNPKGPVGDHLTHQLLVDFVSGGGTVKVSGLVDKQGKAYHGYITWQPGQKYPAFMFPKDYKTALEEGRVKPAVENEVQVAVNSQGKTNESTKSLKEALQSAQTQPTGEQKQQKDRKEQQKEDKKQEQRQEQKQDKPKQRKGVRR